jgi:NAD(P)-dependent dehydrogenase (short-subunit alcohol dehydrogenase family)
MSAEPLKGRRALVTGASRGIGAATVTALRGLGAEVVAVARSPFGSSPSDDHLIRPVSADVADWSSVSAALAGVADVDILINCAGVPGQRLPVWELDPTLFRRALEVNALGAFHLMRLVLPLMVARRRGVVVNVVSGAAERPRPTRAMYGASKAALDHLTRASALEAREAGVRIYAFHPGMVDTQLFRSTRTSSEAQREIAEARAAGELQHPGQPAAAIAYLATDAGAEFSDVTFPWRDTAFRAGVTARPGFPTP